MGKNFTRIMFLLFVLLLAVPAKLMAQINCETPANLTSANISPTGAVLYLGTTADAGTYNIRYHGPGTTTWTTLNNVTVPFQLGGLTCNTAYEWQAQRVCGTTPNNVAVLSAWSLGAAFTTTACSTPTCPTPTNLTSTNISQNGAVLSTGANTVSGVYNIRYHGPNSTNWITLNNVTIPYQLGNLTCGTAYEWQLQQVCGTSAGAVNLGAWSAGAVFTTIPCTSPTPCPVPTNLTATNISQTGAVLHFGTTATSGRYNIRYHGPNSTTWITVNNVTVPFQLGNLACGTAYEWQAQQICTITGAQNYNFSDWSVGAAFTTLPCSTPPDCPVPTYLSTTNISQTGAVLNLGTIANTGTFNIRYHGPNSTAWIVINNVTMPYQLGNLTCLTGYEWQAQKVCSNTPGTAPVLSAWSVGSAFTTLACPTSNCPVPTNLTSTNISLNGVVLSLGANSPAGMYNIRYHGPNSTNWITVNNVTMPYQLGNLACGTVYEWQAQQICANSGTTTGALSAWSTGVAFTTLACPVPTCPVPTYLSTTNISQTGAVLNLGTTANPAGIYNIRYHGPNSATWITINNVTMPYQLGNLTCNTTYEWQAQQVCANSGTTTGALSAWSVGSAFTTTACPVPTTCPVPTYLSTTNISQTGAVLNLGTIANTGIFNIRYRVPNTPNWIVINNITMPYQLGNLTCHTGYEWQAQKVCSNADNSTAILSAWSPSIIFTTTDCPVTTCPVPTNLTATNISQTGAVLHFGTAATSGRYNIRYHGPNSTTWIMINNVTVPFQLGNLTCHTTYEWQAQKICGSSTNGAVVLSPWSLGAAFTTAACPDTTCAAPTNLTATNISPNGAVLHFGTTATDGRYNIRYHGPNSTNWITVNNVTVPFQLGNLTCHTTYEWQAQKICGSSTNGAVVLSPWSLGAVFTTTACPTPACPVPTNLSATNITQNGALLHWSAITGVTAYIVRYKPAYSDAPFTTVTSTTNSIQISNLNVGAIYTWQVSAVCANGTTVAPYWSQESRFMTRSQLLAYPNPGNGTVSISFSSDRMAPVQVKLMDLYGKEIIVEKRDAVEGGNVFNINTSEVSDGLYFIGIYSDDVLTTTKVVIKH
ncbi:MAG TPA: fibronectin type III domain-containing protein [Flavobacterium sp.]|uniref:fibronectin type III domain-containing protein n=1 Tax=Flavobacterium sp. TaxID=239 RepID=UPI002C029014|nr:fibronectin type III domain-containing protein [Flavobacterium sp.]HSD13732.1 fibronectin type III domain-containing protein [Flavobacterium sp.]